MSGTFFVVFIRAFTRGPIRDHDNRWFLAHRGEPRYVRRPLPGEWVPDALGPAEWVLVEASDRTDDRTLITGAVGPANGTKPERTNLEVRHRDGSARLVARLPIDWSDPSGG